MKLGKEVLLAILETALFVIGAIFFLLVVIIPTNPIWALVAGIICGLAGAMLWLYPFFIHTAKRIRHKIHNRIENTKVDAIDAEEVAQKIQGSNKPKDNPYELHRTDSYDNITDEIIANATESTEAATETEVQSEPVTEAEPVTELATEIAPKIVSIPAQKPEQSTPAEVQDEPKSEPTKTKSKKSNTTK